MAQFVHLLTSAGGGLPTDLWVPSTAKIKPQQSSQVAVGIARTIKSKYEFTLETYYKQMQNLIEYKDGASFTNISLNGTVSINPDTDWQNKVVTGGKGECYGTEVFLQKKTGVITGWIGYTLAWNYRKFNDLNFGQKFPYKYDRRHDVSIALAHNWNDRMDFSMAWTFGTGNAVTLPVASYDQAVRYGEQLYHYQSRNSFRMRSYHRLDLSFSFWKDKNWGQRKWTVGLYNAYNRKNPFYMESNFGHGYQFVQHTLFPITPFVTYSIKF
jgi:hypothetical protein